MAQIMTTGLAGGLTQPYKGMVPAALKRSEDLTTAPISHGSPFKGAVFLLALFYPLSRKRVHQLFHSQPFILLVFC